MFAHVQAVVFNDEAANAQSPLGGNVRTGRALADNDESDQTDEDDHQHNVSSLTLAIFPSAIDYYFQVSGQCVRHGRQDRHRSIGRESRRCSGRIFWWSYGSAFHYNCDDSGRY